jgi:Ca2+-binding EF-hand superfamily protein
MARYYLVTLLFFLSLTGPALCQISGLEYKYRRRLIELFHRLDTDADGKLSSRELGKYPRFRNLDRNRDGEILLTDLGDYNTLFVGERLRRAFLSADLNYDLRLNRNEAKIFPRLYQQFRRFDRNHNGYISLEEMILLRQILGPFR